MSFPSSPQTQLMGTGVSPGGGLGAQLAAITRRAVVPVVTVQIYQTHPLLSLLMSNAQPAKGGAPQIVLPIQGASFVNFSWGSFAGDFPMPTDQQAIENAQFNLKLGMVPMGFFGMEALVQSSEVIIPKLRVMTSDAAVKEPREVVISQPSLVASKPWRWTEVMRQFTRTSTPASSNNCPANSSTPSRPAPLTAW